MDKYSPYPSIIAMFTSDSQHPPRSKHAVYLGDHDKLYLSVFKTISIMICGFLSIAGFGKSSYTPYSELQLCPSFRLQE